MTGGKNRRDASRAVCSGDPNSDGNEDEDPNGNYATSAKHKETNRGDNASETGYTGNLMKRLTFISP